MITFPLRRRAEYPRGYRSTVSNRYDQEFLTRILAQKDPLLQQLNSVASFVLDDHPYPRNAKDFQRRTMEINRNIRRLHLSSSDQNFLDRLMMETGVNVVDLWQGSHIIVHDQGHLYHRWSTNRKARPRFSSHYQNLSVQQYGISFKDHQLLFGKTGRHGSTWFQMEAHGFDPNDILNNPNLALYHGQDFLKYRYHNLNVGPFGFSPHTETNHPIKLPYRSNAMQSSSSSSSSSRILTSNNRVRAR